MKKSFILNKKKEINDLFAKKQCFQTNHVWIYYKTNNAQNLRFLITISKKIAKKAVLRNKTRRQIKAIIHHYRFFWNRQIDFAILPKKSFLELTFQQKKDHIYGVLKKIDKKTCYNYNSVKNNNKFANHNNAKKWIVI